MSHTTRKRRRKRRPMVLCIQKEGKMREKE